MKSNYFWCVKKIIFILGILFVNIAQSQNIYKGFVYDSAFKTTLNPVRVENLTTHEGRYTNEIGYFEIEAKHSDHIIFSMVGYKNQIVIATENNASNYISVYLKPTTIMLKNVTIKRGPTQYQLDSARRADIYKDVFEYQQQKSINSPITSVYEKFSAKHKNIRKFKEQIENMEKQNFIDSRYTKELVMTLTKLDEEEAQTFMNAYPMEYDYARAATDLEIKMWIKYNFSLYSKKKIELE